MLFCLPLGVVAIVYAVQVTPRWESGDVEGAKRASRNARSWANASLGVVVLAVLLAVGLYATR